MPEDREDKDVLFGRLALERGYLTREQLDGAVEARRVMQEQLGVEQPLAQVLLGKKLLTPDQAQDLRHAVAVKTGEARLVAGYEVVAKIGQGGMGAVYKARKLDTGEFVALKILLPSLATPEYVKRFQRESRVVQKLSHENIVSCVEFGRDERRGLHFCALEFVAGEDLDKRVKRLGALPEDEAISITRQVAEALGHAYMNGLVHRDIKPENVMVTPGGTVKLLDLGLARPVSQEATRLTQSGMFVGSVYYASPEQAKASKEIDIRADIYSLGATLYYMITGRPPFEGATALAVLQAHVYEQIQWPAEINPAISEDLCLVVAKMMAKDPGDRYETPEDLIGTLDGLKEGKRPEIGERVRKGSTIAQLGAVVKRRRGPAPRDRRRPVRERAVKDERRTRFPGKAAEGAGRPVWLLAGLGAAAAVVVVGLVLVFALGGKEEEEAQKLPPVMARGHDTGAEPRVPSRSERGHAGPARMEDEGGRMKTSSAFSVPPSSSPRSAAGAFRETEAYERAQPGDPEGVIKKYEAVAREFPGTIEAGKAKVNVIRLRSVLARATGGPKKRVARPPGVPEDAVSLGGHRYKLYRRKGTWHEAKRFCEERGGHLVTITSKEENGFVVSLLRERGEEPAGHLWIGLTDEKQEGKFEWVTGEAFVYSNWRRNQPDNENDADCVYVKRVDGYTWTDIVASFRNGFICEWEPGAARGARVRGREGEAPAEPARREARPPTADGARKPRPAVLDAILSEFGSLVGEGDLAGAGRRVESAARDPKNVALADALRAAAGVVESLGGRREAIRRAVESLVGKEAAFETQKGRLKGRVGEVTGDGFVLVKEIKRGRRVLGETRIEVAWSDLAPAEEDRLARKGGWKAEGADGAIVRAILAGSREDQRTAKAVLDAAGDHPLAEVLRVRMEAAEKEAAYDKAMRRARSHLRGKRWKKAVAACEEALTHKPDDPEAAKLLAEANRHIGPAPTLTLDLGGGVTMEMVYIKPGVFMMGGTEDPKHGWRGVEKPKHEVAITRGFYIGRYEVTRGQFAAFVKATGYRTEAEKEGKSWGRRTDGSWGEIAGASWRDPVVFAQDDTYPVMCVSWNDVKAFCDWAAARTRRGVRLPTEAEWEYACRAGTTTRFSFGDSEGALGEYAWHDKNSGWQTHPVGQKKPNAWGLHDVHGNVWEWVADWYDAGYYAKSPRENPAGPNSGRDRLLRGGSWNAAGYGCGSALRFLMAPSSRSPDEGFRAAVSASPPGR